MISMVVSTECPIAGSLEKRKGLKKLAKSIGSKINVKHKKKEGETDDLSSGSINSLKRRTGTYDNVLKSSKQVAGDADPGVVSEDEDEFTFDDLSHNSSTSSLNHGTKEPLPPSPAQNNEKAGEALENLAGGEVLRRHTVAAPPKKPARFEPSKPLDEWEKKLCGGNRLSWDPSKLSSQIEEEEPSELTVPVPVQQHVQHSPKPETKKEGKERGLSKLKNFRKGQ